MVELSYNAKCMDHYKYNTEINGHDYLLLHSDENHAR